MSGMLEPTVALAMPGEVGRAVFADRHSRGPPDIAGVNVAHVDDLARPVDDGVVRPRRQLILPAIGRPRVAAAFGRHLEAEHGIAEDVDPGCGRPLALAKDRHIFPSARDDAGEALTEF